MLFQVTVHAYYFLSLLLTNLLSTDEDTTIEAAKYQHAILTQAVAASQPEGNTSHFRLLLAS